ncbi:cell division protein SepF [Methanolobus psychrotolerans]|uniref:cell division protein SepF n=1 Tax=Methanolobus psychrotolerans TaxID=1874706 RepID=UPI000B918AC2|nr:cell division protein SepF [Methanolobus psychrotolerans]
MANIMNKLFGGSSKSSTTEDEYTELDLTKYEEVMDDEPAQTYIRVAELTNLNELTSLKKEIYDGNIVMIDISHIKVDKLLLDRALKDLKEVVLDVHGDIAGIKDDQVLVTPTGIKIDRSKIIGGRY